MLKVERHDFEEQFGGLFLIRTRALLTQIAEEPGDEGMDHRITIIFRRGKILVRKSVPVRAPIFGLGVPRTTISQVHFRFFVTIIFAYGHHNAEP